ncbi:uncharacterized protein LOC142975952 [Anticarsia gemmatalis]|uniref:uncharacterized protein LOC142975952 n=1 Tax=Anticarsia gemmatalis TaxID=129554 RepID=UPI003F76F90B
MVSKYSLIFVFYVFVFCDSSYVPNIKQCQIADSECTKKWMQKFFIDNAEKGVEEIGMPPLDPLPLNDITLKIADLIDITLKEGQIAGLKDCEISKFQTNLQARRTNLDIMCDVKLEGNYKAFSNNPLVQELLKGFGVNDDGNKDDLTLTGDGFGKVEIQKLKIGFEFYFKIVKRDGETYIKTRPKKTKYTFDVVGDIKFFADKILIRGKDFTKQILDVLNQNWRFLMSSFGNHVSDKAVEICALYFGRFFDNVPTKQFLLDDLSSYVKE